jgi:hypothetical protein
MAKLNTDSTEEQVAGDTPRVTPRVTLDAWSWIARARQAAARAMEPVAPDAEAAGEPDLPAD